MKRSLIIGALLMLAACAQQPPPPPVATNPPPPPPPPPPPTYSVYFDYNSSLLGPSAKEIVRLAADSYKAGSPGTIQVIGYTDPSGSGPYNQKLSLKRASAKLITSRELLFVILILISKSVRALTRCPVAAARNGNLPVFPWSIRPCRCG